MPSQNNPTKRILYQIMPLMISIISTTTNRKSIIRKTTKITRMLPILSTRRRKWPNKLPSCLIRRMHFSPIVKSTRTGMMKKVTLSGIWIWMKTMILFDFYYIFIYFLPTQSLLLSWLTKWSKIYRFFERAFNMTKSLQNTKNHEKIFKVTSFFLPFLAALIILSTTL